MRLLVRYYYIYGKDKERIESDFHHVEKVVHIDPSEAALVLLDIWNETTYLDNTFSRRARRVTEERIVPVIEAARRIGMTIVHAPSPELAERHPEWVLFARDEGGDRNDASQPDWPPPEFIKRERKYQAFGRMSKTLGDEVLRKLDIDEPVKPHPNDFMIAKGDQLHALLREKKVLHLFYVGFYANVCILLRDYGVRAMGDRGYNTILLRDCTTAIEAHDTVNKLQITELSIRHIEMLHGFSSTAEGFIAACRGSS